jgi:hypothetical protein
MVSAFVHWPNVLAVMLHAAEIGKITNLRFAVNKTTFIKNITLDLESYVIM